VQFDDTISAIFGPHEAASMSKIRSNVSLYGNTIHGTSWLFIKQIDERFVDASDGKPYFGYCAGKGYGGWMLMVSEYDGKNDPDPCDGILAKSTSSDATEIDLSSYQTAHKLGGGERPKVKRVHHQIIGVKESSWRIEFSLSFDSWFVV
jgi:hypothetical protein